MTDAELLDAALWRHDDWDKLYEACLDRAQAEALARVLGQNASGDNPEAAAWAKLLGEMHSGLRVTWASKPEKKRRLRVLCAEDHPDVRLVIQKSLTDAGCQVIAFCDGLAAWRYLAAHIGDVDTLITDLQMPGMSGLELVRRGRAAGFAGHIIVQTGNLPEEVRDALAALRVDRIVMKSTRPDCIVGLVEALG